MRRYRKWVLTLGVAAAMPGAAHAELPWGAKQAPAAHGNQKVAEEIAAALGRNQLKGRGIEIQYKDGVAGISGEVADPAQKEMASQVMRSIDGVKRVDNRLTVKADAPATVARKSAAPKGAVQTASHEQAAGARDPFQQVAHEVPAMSEQQANQAMAQQIATSLGGAQLGSDDVEIRFQNGTCTLLGSVPGPEQRQRATQFAGQVPGVQSVDNRLRVMPAGGPSQPPVFPAAYQPNGDNGGAMPPAPGPAGPAMQGYPGAGYPGAGYPAPGYPGPGYPAMGPGVPAVPPAYATPPGGASDPAVYNNPNLPPYAWPTYAAYPNAAALTYPTQYSASAWPYIGPFYPYPQVPLGWRKATLEWDDGQWYLNFRDRTDRWWWFMHPKNW